MTFHASALVLVSGLAVSVVAGHSPDAAAVQEAGVYRTQFENEWLRLVRVRYPANTAVPVHGHPSTVTVYVYLSESSPIRFTHHGSRTHVVTRQPTTPGGFRVSRGGDESHAAENLGPIASDYLRVEFKTEPGGNRSPFFRDGRRLTAGRETATDVRFTNAQMRVTRVAVPAGQSAEIATAAAAPALLLALDPATLTMDGASVSLTTGQERWIAPSRRERLTNAGTTPIELLRIDFLTAPRAASL